MSKPLTFEKFRKQMVKSQEWYPQSKSWVTADWVLAMVGEFGEMANFLKKVRRGSKKWEEVKPEVAKEMADVLMYMQRLAEALDISLEDAIIGKFNEVSKKCNSKVRL